MAEREPDSLDALQRELTVERFLTTNRDLPQIVGERPVEAVAVLAERRRVLEELPAEDGEGALVVPFGRRRKDVAA